MSRICIIGGAGFIGSRLASILKSKSRDYYIVDKDVGTASSNLSVKADVRNKLELMSAVGEGDILINLAAEHRDDVTPKSLYFEVNVDGAKNICAAAEQKGVTKIVFTSSVAVYGFAPADTGESGDINPFNEYGESKHQAEKIFIEWQKKDPDNRMLCVVRPTVVFGERNRGNVYNLLRQIACGTFVMIGNGRNKKSMAYVANVASFIEYSTKLGAGIHVYNYVDKPDFDMNDLVFHVRAVITGKSQSSVRIPYWAGLCIGHAFDFCSMVTGRKFPISSIRVKKFCSTTQFATSIGNSGFVPPESLSKGLEKTLKFEFKSNKQ